MCYDGSSLKISVKKKGRWNRLKDGLRFIHAADLHLDSPFKGLAHVPKQLFKAIQESTFHALDRIVEAAIEKEVDFVLFVGDLFDNDKQSLQAQMKLKAACEKLQQHHIHVYLSYGNHDHISGNRHPIVYPDNVHIFPTERVSSFDYSKNGETLAKIFGFSYENRAVMENKVAAYQRADDNTYHIGMLHGSLHGNEAHDPYAPFALSALQAQQFDYWALGHIHKREVLAENPPIIYPGNTQGRHRNESGVKGCYYIELTGHQASYTFIPTSDIVFESITMDISSCERVDVLLEKLQATIGTSATKRFIHLTLEGDETSALINDRLLIEEVIDVLNEQRMEEALWTYIYRHKLIHRVANDIVYHDFFIGQLAQTLDELSIEDATADLWQHRKARPHLEKVETETIRAEAKAQLMNFLQGKGKG